MGTETSVGSSIKQLSSGQKQRISIARSFYSDRKVLIFDEATNALDVNTEESLIDSIKNLSSDITIIFVTHRLSTLSFCDRIFKINKGELEILS